MSVSDLSQMGWLRCKKYSDTTLMLWTKKELIKYIRMLEGNYDNAVIFNELQARNVEKMLKDREENHDSAY